MLEGKHANKYVQEQWGIYREFDVYEFRTANRDIAYKLEQSLINVHMENPAMLNIAGDVHGGGFVRCRFINPETVDRIVISSVNSMTWIGKAKPIPKGARRRKRRKRSIRKKKP